MRCEPRLTHKRPSNRRKSGEEAEEERGLRQQHFLQSGVLKNSESVCFWIRSGLLPSSVP